MKIYLDRVLIDEVPDFRPRRGSFFSRLAGVNVSCAGNRAEYGVINEVVVEPVYMSLLDVQRSGSEIVIWINSYERPLAMIFLRKRWPWVQVFKYDWLTLNEET